MKEKKLSIGKCIGLVIAAWLMREIGSTAGSLILAAAMGKSALSGFPAQMICGALGDILMAALLIIAGRKYILTHNMSKFGKGLLIGLVSIGFSFYALGVNIGSAVANKMSFTPGINALWFTLAMIAAPGIGEELLFRGCIMNFVRDAAGRNTKKGLFTSMIVSSVLFGAIHLLNVNIVGLKISLYQAVIAMFIGFFFAAVYARTNCLWVTIFLHFFHDFCAMFATGFLTSSDLDETLTGTMSGVNILGAAINLVIFVGAGIFLMRKSKIDECFEKTEENEKIEMTNAAFAN